MAGAGRTFGEGWKPGLVDRLKAEASVRPRDQQGRSLKGARSRRDGMLEQLENGVNASHTPVDNLVSGWADTVTASPAGATERASPVGPDWTTLSGALALSAFERESTHPDPNGASWGEPCPDSRFRSFPCVRRIPGYHVGQIWIDPMSRYLEAAIR